MKFPTIKIHQKIVGISGMFANGKLTLFEMKHTIKQLAINFNLNVIALTRFAVAHDSKYGTIIENGKVYTTTSFADALIKDFKQSKVKRYTSPYLQPEDVIGYNVHDWESSLSPDGIVYWEPKPKLNLIHISILATPCYDKDGITPFELMNPVETTKILDLHISHLDSINEQREYYFAFLKTVFEIYKLNGNIN